MGYDNSKQHSPNHAQQTGHSSHHGQRLWDQGKNPKENCQINDEKQATEALSQQKESVSQKSVKTFRDLTIWQKGILLVKSIYQKTGSFPKEELYGLVAQMRRAAVSIPSNIAEGYRRRHSKEFQQFLNVSLGSLGEIETQVIIASDLNYLSAENSAFLLEEIDHLTRMVISLNNKVQR